MHETVEKHYRTHHDKLVRKFSWFCKNERDGEDVVQDAYTKAIRYYDPDCPPLNFEHWFSRILFTCAQDHRRLNFGNSLDVEEEEFEGVPCNEYNAEMVRQVYEFIATKPDDIKERLYLHFKYGYSAMDIHNIVGGPYITSAKLISRFREELKERFDYA